MALVRVVDEDRTIIGIEPIATYLRSCGIEYEYWKPEHAVAADAPPDEILAAYAHEIETLKARGGYVTADVIDITPDTPGLEPMLAKFNREHWHEEDEVRFIISGRGLFHIHPENRSVVSIEVEAGDLIRIPRGTWHWFWLTLPGKECLAPCSWPICKPTCAASAQWQWVTCHEFLLL